MKTTKRLMWGVILVAAPFVVRAAFAGEEKDPAAAMQELGQSLAMENPEGGGSIRAKKEPDMSAQQRKNDKRNAQARVVAVKRGAFPQVALSLKITKAPDDGPNKDKVKKDQAVVVLPVYKMAGKAVDWSDPASVQNAGAFYLADGDTVYVRLDAQDGKLWKVGYIERR